jgi:hypothetical protein
MLRQRPICCFLGFSVFRNRPEKKLFISQEDYVEAVLERFGMTDCRPVKTSLSSGFKSMLEASHRRRGRTAANGATNTSRLHVTCCGTEEQQTSASPSMPWQARETSLNMRMPTAVDVSIPDAPQQDISSRPLAGQ